MTRTGTDDDMLQRLLAESVIPVPQHHPGREPLTAGQVARNRAALEEIANCSTPRPAAVHPLPSRAAKPRRPVSPRHRSHSKNGVLAVTVPPPSSHCIAHGHQQVISRRWPLHWRGTLLIHAAQYPDHAAEQLPHIARAVPDPAIAVRGAIVAIATIADSHQANGTCCAPWGDTGSDQFHWRLANVRPLPTPVPCDGAQRLWPPTQRVLDAVAKTFPLIRYATGSQR
ncbi:hypothetical protein ACFV3E_36595 [Streptomyces sp. NPDC059718]